MTKRRHAQNPAKVRADISALEKHPPPEIFSPRLDIRRRPSVLLLCLLTAALLLISFAPFGCWYLAYFALVPWGLAMVGGASARWAMWWGYLTGVIFWAAGAYWLTWVTMVGYIPLVMYLGFYWLVAAWLLRKAFARGWPSWVVLPVLWVSLEYARAYVISGFPWFFLAHSQYSQTQLIQITDLTGQYGVSFFVAMVNGAIIDAFAQPLFIRERGRVRLTKLIGGAAAACLVVAAGMMGYGAYRLRQDVLRPGPKIGVVQMAFPISLMHKGASSQEILDAHIVNSRPLAEARCDLVVWPESMAGADMDPDKWRAFDPDARDPRDPTRPAYTPTEQEGIRTQQANVSELGRLVRELGCPLLTGAAMPPIYTIAKEGERVYANSALLLKLGRDERLHLRGRYDKRHLVPFSEYVPFRQGWPWLYRQLRRVVPKEMPQLEPGRSKGLFEIQALGRTFRIAAPICYEGTFARVCRDLVDKHSGLGADIIVNVSNDGWFIYRGPKYIIGGEQIVHASAELEQHLVQYVFRAIENRVPIVRAVNTGISAHVTSQGEIVQWVSSQGGRREMVAGNMVARIAVDDRKTVYGRVGDLFALAVSVLAVAAAALLLLRGRRERRRGE